MNIIHYEVERRAPNILPLSSSYSMSLVTWHAVTYFDLYQIIFLNLSTCGGRILAMSNTSVGLTETSFVEPSTTRREGRSVNTAWALNRT